MRRLSTRKLTVLSYSIGLVCALIAISPEARAQQQNTGTQSQQNQTEEPIPAYRSPYVGASDETDGNSQTMSPDTRPLSGAQYFSVGTLNIKRSYWQPHFDVTGSADSNPQEGPSSTNWGAWTAFTAGVDIHHISGSSNLTVAYTGGGMFSSEKAVSTGTVQQLGFTEKISFRRSVLSILDQLSYLPQAGLGFGGLGDLPLTGGGAAGLGPGATNQQTILTGQGQNLENSSVVQLQTFLTPRTSITMAGGYSLLRFFGSNLVNSTNMNFQGGYNYELTEHNTLALVYGFNRFGYSNFNNSIDSHTMQAAFGRRITGRLAFQVGAGPEFTFFNQGSASSGGTGAGSGAAGNPSSRVNWSLNSAVTYQHLRTAFGLNYWHGVTSGSGVVAGSLSDMVTGSITHQMSRTFSSGFTGGYSRNSSLLTLGGASSTADYSYWFAGATFARPLSETLALTLSYQMQYQNANVPFCIGPTCGTGLVRHLISVGLSWNERPLLF